MKRFTEFRDRLRLMFWRHRVIKNFKDMDISNIATSADRAKWLMELGTIEKLILERRTPIQMGESSAGDDELQPCYYIPPKDHDPTSLMDIYWDMAILVFVYKDGTEAFGSSLRLTCEQAREVEERVLAEEERLGR